MTPFHLNQGSLLRRPYESVYAILRRHVIANPGISFTHIKTSLRASLPQYKSTEERLYAIEHGKYGSFVSQKLQTLRSNERQCPMCALQLYHSDIYALPWLIRCPIHHCEFTSKCPECNRNWPNIQEIAKHECAYCGQISFEQLTKIVLPSIRKQDYKSIVDIYKLLLQWRVATEIFLLEREYDFLKTENWLRYARITSSQFASFIAQQYQHPDYSLERLISLEIQANTMNCISAQLTPAKYEGIPIRFLRYSATRRKYDTQEAYDFALSKRIAIDFEVLTTIIAFISSHTSRSHRIHVASYRYLDIGDFIESPDHCPYCLAFSVWLFCTAFLHYGDPRDRVKNKFPFCVQGGLNHVFHGYEPDVIIGTEHYLLDADFLSWFYRRGQVVSFLDLLRFSFSLLCQARKYRMINERIYLTPFFDRNYSDRLCHVHAVANRLDFYYENEHPLDAYTPTHINDIDTQCQTYQNHHSSRKIYDKVNISFDALQWDTIDAIEFHNLLKKLGKEDWRVNL